jgi:IMP dehydrogenase
VPQISAVANVAAALEGTGIPVIADGGVRFSGDMAKAIAAGAHCIMVGSMLAGTEEAPGEVELPATGVGRSLFPGRRRSRQAGAGGHRGPRAVQGHAGARDLADDGSKPQFVRITNAGMRESHVHDVTITKEAPNYRVD